MVPLKRLVDVKAWILQNIVVPRATKDLCAFIDEVQPDFIMAQVNAWTIALTALAMPRVKRHWHVSVHDFPDELSFGPRRRHSIKRN